MTSRRHLGAMATCAVTLLVLPGVASPQAEVDGGPIVVGTERDFEVLHLYGLEAAVEFEWRRNVDSVEPAGGSRRTDREDRLREILELRTEGFIGHPELLELDLGGRFWPEQRWLNLDSAGESERVNQTLLDWDVSGQFIKESKLPFTVYSRQNITDVDRQFGGTLENRFRESGVRLNLRSAVVPTNFQVFDRRIEQRDPTAGQDFTIDQKTIRADGRIELGAAQRLAWDILHDDIDESGDLRQALSFQRVEGNLAHAVDFGEADQNTLRTRVRYYDESGDREFRQLRVDPRLRLRHTEDLLSWYDYSYERNDRPLQQQRANRFNANVQYQLFDSLTTTATFGVNQLDIPTESFDSTEVFGRADVDYIKQVILGRLQMGVAFELSTTDQSERGAPIAIDGQAFVFGPSGLIVIDQRNVVASSIFITDITGVIVYTEGLDYTVLAFPDRVEIRRVAGGDIGPGQAVLIDYVIGPEPGGTTDRDTVSVEVRYRFEEGPLSGLSVYGIYIEQDESRSTVTEEFPDNDFTDLRYGVEYDVWKLYFRAERQERESTLSPFDVLRLEGRYTEPLGRGSSLVLSALYQDIDREEGIATQTTTLSGQWNQQFNANLRTSLSLQYQMNEDNIALETDAFEQRFNLLWQYRSVEVYAEIRNSTRSTTTDDTDFQRFVLGLRREF
ncbi:MAG: hypothetical protein ACYTGR_08305 [Planctomycetota bacterium]